MTAPAQSPAHDLRRVIGFAGGVALGIMMIPTVCRTTEEVLLMVPQSIREAALGLGIPQWRTTISVVVRTVGPWWEGLDRRREEAAAALGASPVRVLATVTLPALRPAIVSAPASPSSVFAAALPVRILSNALPVPLMAEAPVKVRFSTLELKV